MIAADIVEMFDELITERTERGNAQSKHGPEAARDYEVFVLKVTLDRIMTRLTTYPNKVQAQGRYRDG